MKNIIYAYPHGFLKLIRFPNLLIVAITQIFTAKFLVGISSHWGAVFTEYKLLFLVTSTVLITAGGYVINDYYDVKIDVVNKPSRLVVGRIMSRRITMFVHIVLTFAGLFIAQFLGMQILVIHFFAAFLLWLYSNKLKRVPFWGNFSVAFLTALAVFTVAVLYKTNYLPVLFYSVFAFFISLLREIIKDMEDVKGDKRFGCFTLPIKHGIRASKKIIYNIQLLFFLLLIGIGWYTGLNLLIFYIFLVIIPLFIFSLILFYADTKKDFSFLSLFCKLIMLCGILSMVFI